MKNKTIAPYFYSGVKPHDVLITILDSEPSEADLWTGKTVVAGHRASGNSFIDRFALMLRQTGYADTTVYARLMGLQPLVLSHTMLALSGMTAKEWSSEYIDLAVCELLRKTDMEIREVARRMGFSSGNTLDFFFKRMHKGMTPFEYRNGYKRKYNR
ncbi:MAG: helix-turn-helix domain-containing protein [Bacteroidales bacterium]|jgi:methylphosphotriester-DNA--protein-cysteine methyltransferase|nr:helix-turn-helix domain-containing protein [Bacteroidales bacterium]